MIFVKTENMFFSNFTQQNHEPVRAYRTRWTVGLESHES